MRKSSESNQQPRVIVLADTASRNPGLVCPVCQYMSRDARDSQNVREQGACTECFTNFRHLMGEEWDKGIRPTVEVARYKMHGIIKA